MKQMAHEYLEQGITNKVELSGPRIERTRQRAVLTTTYKKQYKIVYDKCRVLASGVTLPFGY